MGRNNDDRNKKGIIHNESDSEEESESDEEAENEDKDKKNNKKRTNDKLLVKSEDVKDQPPQKKRKLNDAVDGDNDISMIETRVSGLNINSHQFIPNNLPISPLSSIDEHHPIPPH